MPRRSRSIGTIITPWLGIVLVALGVGAAVGPLHATADAATRSHETAQATPPGEAATGAPEATPQPPEEPAATPTVCSLHMNALPETWMRDIDPCIRYRRLSDIVIPGSHDSVTYNMIGLAQTQFENLTDQLNSGVRVFDIRVGYFTPVSGFGYYAEHGGIPDLSLTFDSIITDLATWAYESGREQEIIMINLTIAQNLGDPFPTTECAAIGNDFGSNLVTPDMLLQHFGTADPGELTFDQLWSLPQFFPGARIIIDHLECLAFAASNVAQWGPISPPTHSFLSGYYADQCTAAGIEVPENNQWRGISVMVNEAASVRGTEGPGSTPIPVGPSAVGGLYLLQVAGTPEAGCLTWPINMVDDQQIVWDQLKILWDDPTSTVRDHLNVVSADFVDADRFWGPIVNMNVEPVPPDPPAITGLTSGLGQVSVAFVAPADQGTGPVTSYTVIYTSGDGSFHSVTGTSSPITVTGLTSGQDYVFAMTATNAAGTSELSGYSNSITVESSPPPPATAN